MTKIILAGCAGRMGRAVSELARESSGAVVVAGIDLAAAPSLDFPVYAEIGQYSGEADAVLDFSHKSMLAPLLDYCVARSLPAVIAATGHEPGQLEYLNRAAEQIPVFKSANMSVGVCLMAELVRRASAVLGDEFDIEIIEKHHSKKLDAPSGTALILAGAAADGRERRLIYDRHAVRREREKDEIGIHTVRGGTIIGEHEVIFAGFDETLSITHSVQSREVFAAGALRAARFIAGVRAPGLYDMNDLVRAI